MNLINTIKNLNKINEDVAIAKEIEESEKYQAKLVKKAIELAKHSSGNFDRAYDRIEKMKKGLGDHPMVARALKTANEGVEQYVDLDKLFEEELKEKFGPLAKAWQKGSKSVKSGDLEFVRGNRGSHTIKKNGKVIGDFSLDTDVDKWVANIKGQKGQMTVDDIDDFASQLKESVELNEQNVSVKKLGDAIATHHSPRVAAQVLGYLKPGTKNQVPMKHATDAMLKANISPKKIANVMSTMKEEVELDEKWKKGKYVVKDKNDKVLGTYNSGSAASKAMNKLIDNGNYDELTVVLKEEVELEEGSISGVTKALGNLAKKPEYKKISNALNGLANPVNMPPKKQAGAINRRLKQLATKVDKKAGAKLLRIAQLASTYESVEIEEAISPGQILSVAKAINNKVKGTIGQSDGGKYIVKANGKRVVVGPSQSGEKISVALKAFDRREKGDAVAHGVNRLKEEVELEEAVNAKEKGRLSFKFGRKPEHNPYPKGSDDAKDWSAGYSAAKAAEKKRDPRYRAEEKDIFEQLGEYEVYSSGSMLFLKHENKIIASGEITEDSYVFGFKHKDIHPNDRYQPAGMIKKTKDYTHIGFNSVYEAIGFAEKLNIKA